MHVVGWKKGEASNGTIIMLDDESSSIGSVNVSVGACGQEAVEAVEAARQRPSSNWP